MAVLCLPALYLLPPPPQHHKAVGVPLVTTEVPRISFRLTHCIGIILLFLAMMEDDVFHQ